MELSDADLAARVVDTLNRFVGSLHAVRCTAAFWIAHAEKPGFRFAAKYSLQMTFGTAMITLRKFHDLHLGATSSGWLARIRRRHQNAPGF